MRNKQIFLFFRLKSKFWPWIRTVCIQSSHWRSCVYWIERHSYYDFNWTFLCWLFYSVGNLLFFFLSMDSFWLTLLIPSSYTTMHWYIFDFPTIKVYFELRRLFIYTPAFAQLSCSIDFIDLFNRMNTWQGNIWITCEEYPIFKMMSTTLNRYPYWSYQWETKTFL